MARIFSYQANVNFTTQNKKGLTNRLTNRISTIITNYSNDLKNYNEAINILKNLKKLADPNHPETNTFKNELKKFIEKNTAFNEAFRYESRFGNIILSRIDRYNIPRAKEIICALINTLDAKIAPLEKMLELEFKKMDDLLPEIKNNFVDKNDFDIIDKKMENFERNIGSNSYHDPKQILFRMKSHIQKYTTNNTINDYDHILNKENIIDEKNKNKEETLYEQLSEIIFKIQNICTEIEELNNIKDSAKNGENELNNIDPNHNTQTTDSYLFNNNDMHNNKLLDIIHKSISNKEKNSKILQEFYDSNKFSKPFKVVEFLNKVNKDNDRIKNEIHRNLIQKSYLDLITNYNYTNKNLLDQIPYSQDLECHQLASQSKILPFGHEFIHSISFIQGGCETKFKYKDHNKIIITKKHLCNIITKDNMSSNDEEIPKVYIEFNDEFELINDEYELCQYPDNDKEITIKLIKSKISCSPYVLVTRQLESHDLN